MNRVRGRREGKGGILESGVPGDVGCGWNRDGKLKGTQWADMTALRSSLDWES